MKLIYRAPTLDSAEQALDELEAKWGAKYPRVIKAWRDNWNELSTFYSLPVEMRRLVYTTNVIENYNRGLRKYTKNSVQFPTDLALEKHLYLAMLRITELARTGLLLAQYPELAASSVWRSHPSRRFENCNVIYFSKESEEKFTQST